MNILYVEVLCLPSDQLPEPWPHPKTLKHGKKTALVDFTAEAIRFSLQHTGIKTSIVHFMSQLFCSKRKVLQTVQPRAGTPTIVGLGTQQLLAKLDSRSLMVQHLLWLSSVVVVESRLCCTQWTTIEIYKSMSILSARPTSTLGT